MCTCPWYVISHIRLLPGGFIAPLTRVGEKFPRTPLGVAIHGMSVDVTQAEPLNVLAWLALAFPPFTMSRTGGPPVAAGPKRRHLILPLGLLTLPMNKKKVNVYYCKSSRFGGLPVTQHYRSDS